MRLQKRPGKQNRKRKPSALSWQSLPPMLDEQEAAQQRTATVGNGQTFEIIDGKPTFFLVIPCEQADKPDKATPLYLVNENKLGGAESGVWQCRECTRIFHTRRSWEKHKGIRWITGPEIKVCA